MTEKRQESSEDQTNILSSIVFPHSILVRFPVGHPLTAYRAEIAILFFLEKAKILEGLPLSK